MTGLGLALLSIVLRSYWLGLLSMVLGLFCLLTFNGFMGAIAMVLGWWAFGVSFRAKMHALMAL